MSIAAEPSLADFLAGPTGFLFFTGKGGVGKTSLACTSAIALADGGRPVLLVSTDPASNLDEVLGVRLTSTATQIPDVPQLAALNVDPAQAAVAYREKLVGPYRGKLPEAIVRSMEEQLSGACTMEIAAFDEFSPGSRAQGEWPAGRGAEAPAPLARCDFYSCGRRDPAGSHAGSRSRQVASRLAPGANRSVCLGQQPELCG